jgi:glycine cleavage system H protein
LQYIYSEYEKSNINRLEFRKGERAMVAILFILTVIVFLAIDYIMKKREAQIPATVEQTVTRTHKKVGPMALVSEPYFHPTHTWAKITDDTVTIGVDEFTQKVLGRVQRLDIPKVGSYLRQGDVVWHLFHGKRALPQRAPIEGEVVEINDALFTEPNRINSSPYDDGWILKIKPTALRQNLKNLLHGETARRWLETVRSQFVMRFTAEVGPVCQDGGELIEGAGELLSESEWQEVLNEYFMVDEIENSK